jgi:hypothetical protein
MEGIFLLVLALIFVATIFIGQPKRRRTKMDETLADNRLHHHNVVLRFTTQWCWTTFQNRKEERLGVSLKRYQMTLSNSRFLIGGLENRKRKSNAD